jgi:hypothetical protein
MNRASVELLQHLVRKEARSLLQYVAESDPWTTQPARRELIKSLAHEEQEGVGKIVRYLMRCRVLPAVPDGYPSNFTTINFVALEHLIQPLVEYEDKSIHDLQRQYDMISDDPARTLVHDYLEMKRRHRQALLDPADAVAPPPAPAPAHH